jgi:hypothetical protein
VADIEVISSYRLAVLGGWPEVNVDSDSMMLEENGIISWYLRSGHTNRPRDVEVVDGPRVS